MCEIGFTTCGNYVQAVQAFNHPHDMYTSVKYIYIYIYIHIYFFDYYLIIWI